MKLTVIWLRIRQVKFNIPPEKLPNRPIELVSKSESIVNDAFSLNISMILAVAADGFFGGRTSPGLPLFFSEVG